MATGRSFPTIIRDINQQLNALQKPSEFFLLFAYNISTLSAIRICNEAGIFRRLTASSKPLTVEQLASDIPNTPAARDEGEAHERREYITRMLRAVSGLQLVDEVDSSTYLGNDLTRTFADPGFEAGWAEAFDNACGPHSTLSHMVKWAREKNYTAPTTARDGPYQQARGITGTSTFNHWAQSEPEMFTKLSLWMQRIQQDRLNWSEWFPADKLFAPGADASQDGVFMVDVGGGYGHDLSGMAGRYPNKKIRLVLQDLPNVLNEAKEQKLDPRIELVEHDFFKPQSVKGAQIYFFHKILHDWPDLECRQILTHIRDAMAPHSRIFINDVILPEEKTPLLFSAFDLTMLLQLNAKERSESMWTRLISEVGGLAIKEFWQAPGLKGEGIVEIVKT